MIGVVFLGLQKIGVGVQVPKVVIGSGDLQVEGFGPISENAVQVISLGMALGYKAVLGTVAVRIEGIGTYDPFLVVGDPVPVPIRIGVVHIIPDLEFIIHPVPIAVPGRRQKIGDVEVDLGHGLVFLNGGHVVVGSRTVLL